MSRSGGVLGSDIICESRKTRAQIGGLSCPPDHPMSLPYRDFDASCKTGRLRAQREFVFQGVQYRFAGLFAGHSPASFIWQDLGHPT